MDWLAGLAEEITGNKALTGKISRANTARHAFGMVFPRYPKVLEKVGSFMIQSAIRFCKGKTCVRAVIFDFDGNAAFDSDKLQEKFQ
jgi:cobalt-precorrin-5B (C1)-methyltransferase